jgi:hypothetical protein
MGDQTRDDGEKRVLIQCKSYRERRSKVGDELAHYLVKLGNPAEHPSTVVITHPDLDHVSIRMIGDAKQIQPLVDSHCIDIVQVSHHGTTDNAPPVAAQTILRFVCPLDRLEAVIGDLDEGFNKLMAQHGVRTAYRWYWWQVARSVGAFCFRFLSSMALVHELLKKLGL